jgi:hypothetical protein
LPQRRRMVDVRALAVPASASDVAHESVPTPSPAVVVSDGSGRAVWILALLGFSLLLIAASVVSPVLASGSRVFDGLAERRLEVAGIGVVVLAALLVGGGGGL